MRDANHLESLAFISSVINLPKLLFYGIMHSPPSLVTNYITFNPVDTAYQQTGSLPPSAPLFQYKQRVQQ